MKQQWEPPELEEMPIVILSLHQKWWQKMAAGEKVLELRKTKPQCKAPFRVLVYLRKDREDGYYFHVSRDFNYCSKCGTLLDLDEWKREEEPAAAGEELTLED